MNFKKLSKVVDEQRQQLQQLGIVVDTLIEGKLSVGNLNDYVNCLHQCNPSLASENMDDFWKPLEYKFPQGTKLKYSLSNYASQNSVYHVPIGKLILSFEEDND